MRADASASLGPVSGMSSSVIKALCVSSLQQAVWAPRLPARYAPSAHNQNSGTTTFLYVRKTPKAKVVCLTFFSDVPHSHETNPFLHSNAPTLLLHCLISNIQMGVPSSTKNPRGNVLKWDFVKGSFMHFTRSSFAVLVRLMFRVERRQSFVNHCASPNNYLILEAIFWPRIGCSG